MPGYTPPRPKNPFAFLAEHGKELEAGVVLHDLLERDDLDETSLGRAVQHTLAWLKLHGRSREAHLVLRALIRRYDLDDNMGNAARAVLRWIEANGDAPSAKFFLHTLLERHDLDDESLERVLRAALGWLEARADENGMDFVLRAFLARRDLDEEVFARALLAAFAWLEKHGEEPEAHFLLRAILSRDDLDEPSAKHAVAATLGWLSKHGTIPETSFVLPVLLGREELDKSSAKRALLGALAWLSKHSADPYADFVFIKVLRSRRASPQIVKEAAHIALAWFAHAPPERRAELHRTLSALLHRAAVLDDARLSTVLDASFRWIRDARPPAAVISALLLDLQPAARRLNRLQELRAFSTEAFGGRPATPLPATAGTHWKAFRQFCEELTARARDAHSRVDPLFVRSALDATRKQLEQGNPALATFALPGLLPLSIRAGQAMLLDELRALCEELLRGDTLSPGQRRAIATSCFRLLEAGAFPDRAEGERILGELGIRKIK
jgi:hypothetical protein